MLPSLSNSAPAAIWNSGCRMSLPTTRVIALVHILAWKTIFLIVIEQWLLCDRAVAVECFSSTMTDPAEAPPVNGSMIPAPCTAPTTPYVFYNFIFDQAFYHFIWNIH